ncbi:phage tail domain-containing protein [Liquorilactobacillus nagelii]|uniref:phage tail domain-containing protein n=1 Tax=Liquorilactobacillus nagelii TaxID=82688 RepID=UPI001CCD3A6A|nr:phage tail domain-containing protein [Liquorilactobacillus nagelii]ULQ49060.1 phage tail family protein [Liquorilactobacillus nagelii]
MWHSTERPSTILIERQDGTIYDLGKMGFGVVSFNPPSANWQHTWQQVGKYRASLTNSEVQQTTIPLVLDAFATDNYDMELQRLMLRQIFMSDEYFYVISMRTPYLRWKCVAEAFDITQLDNYHKLKSVSISLLCIDGFAESTATTQTPFTYDSESWGIGENLPNGVDLNYTFTTPSFKVYNASIIPLRAEEHPVTITFQGVVASSLSIENATTGQTFTLSRALTASDSLILKGLVPIVNGSQDYGASNHAYLDLAVGWNEFKITGASSFTISFDTRFYY